MKLSELIFEAKIVKEELDIRSFTDGRRTTKWEVFDTNDPDKRVGNTFDSEGAAEEFRDAERARRANPNAEPSRPARSQPTRAEIEGRKARVADADVKADVSTTRLTQGLSQAGADKWVLNLSDGKTAIIIENKDDAVKLEKRFLDALTDGKTPEQITSMFAQTELDKLELNKPVKVRQNVITRAINSVSIAVFEADASVSKGIANKFFTSKWYKVMFKPILAIGGPITDSIGIFLGVMRAIDQVEEEIKETGDPDGKLAEEKDILRGQLFVMLTASFIPLLRVGRYARLVIRIVSTLIRGGVLLAAGATAATGVGAPVAAGIAGLGFILTTAAEIVVFALLASPNVQRMIAQFLASTILGDIVEGIGEYTGQIVNGLEQYFDGKYGTAFLADALGTEETTTGGIKGEYYSNSEWAKLVFGALLFPEGTPTRLVPYIARDKRERLLSETLGVQSETAPPQLPNQTNQENNPFPALDPNAAPEDLLPPQAEPSVNSGGPGFRLGQ